jgi:hypothetical protein
MATFREELIRAVFEARRDVTWWQKVEPQLKDLGLDATSIHGYRQAWNEDMEQKDWARWQKEATRFSNAVLDDMRMDCNDLLDAIGMLQWQRDKTASDQEKLAQLFNGPVNREDKPQERSKEKGREM